MLWPILGTICSLSIALILLLVVLVVTKAPVWKRNRSRILAFYAGWFVPYAVFILFFTGPKDLSMYPPQARSPYELPWKGGVKRFVAQGNRSFTSHRGSHEFAWDFLMPNGTPILAARAGRVVAVRDDFDGIGLNSNFVKIEHEDGQHSGYFHIQHNGALVKVGESVEQGQPIALSGMVGQTIYPHVHFVVFNKDESASIPISFRDVPRGVPLAGRIYTSGNRSY